MCWDTCTDASDANNNVCNACDYGCGYTSTSNNHSGPFCAWCSTECEDNCASNCSITCVETEQGLLVSTSYEDENGNRQLYGIKINLGGAWTNIT